MLNKMIASTILLSILFVFTGCETIGPADQVTPPTETVSTTETIPAPDQIPETPQEIEVPAAIPISAEDLAIYEGAQKLRDETYCDKITIEELKAQCKQDLAYTSIIDKAVKELDKTVCEKLDADKIEICKIEVDLAVKQYDDWRNLTDEENEIMLRAEEARDISICEEIKSESKRQNCLTNVQVLIDKYGYL